MPEFETAQCPACKGRRDFAREIILHADNCPLAQPQEIAAPVVQLHKGLPRDDIPATLRRIADSIENDEYGPVTTGIVCLGHSWQKPDPDDKTLSLAQWSHEIFAFGPRTDVFTVAGLLTMSRVEALKDHG